MMVRVWCVLIGIVFGLFQTGYFYGKAKGIDIREHGSGNAGSTNILRVLGTKAGFTVLFGDMFKCIFAMLLTHFLFAGAHPEMSQLLKLYTAFGSVIGHDYPFYMNFKGGKGIAVGAGLMIGFHWSMVVINLALFLIIFNITHYVSLGSLAIYSMFLIVMVIEGQAGVYGVIPQPILTEMYIITAIMTILAFWQHRNNIRKLLSHSERKTYLFKKNKTE